MIVDVFIQSVTCSRYTRLGFTLEDSEQLHYVFVASHHSW